MIIYLKEIMDDLQTLVITGTIDISNSDIRIITCGIFNKIHILLDTQTMKNKIR